MKRQSIGDLNAVFHIPGRSGNFGTAVEYPNPGVREFREKVRVTTDELAVELVDGRTVSVPVQWYPRLAHGSRKKECYACSTINPRR